MTIVKEATGSKQQNLKQAAQIAHGVFNDESPCSLGLNRVVLCRQATATAWDPQGSFVRAAVCVLYRPADGAGDQATQICNLRVEWIACKTSFASQYLTDNKI